MTGAASGPLRAQTLTAVREVIARTGIDDLVRILGYVDQELITALYAGATGVVLPTFFGPTNIPVIEGWAMGIPVLTSDIRGIREQCGDAALLVDPRSTEAIADGIRRLWTDDDLRERLVVAGRVRLERHDPADFREELGRIIDDVRRRLASGETRVRAT
jgi:glycosyltransferase involved in cell wall biosynthesis